MFITVYYWNRTMHKSVNALRYLDPTWNKVAPGKRLWPSLAYLFRLRSYDEYATTADANNKEENSSSSADDVKDNVWTLMTSF